MKAVRNVNFNIKDVLVGKDSLNQRKIDKILTETDGTENKSNLGANATLAVSMAAARAASKALDIPLYRYLGGIDTARMPVPMMNILNGGRHATNTVDFQEFMIMPVSTCCFAEGLPDAVAVLDLIVEAIKAAGYKPGTDVKIALDVAASELYNEEDGMYHFPGESELSGAEEEVVRDTEQMIDYYDRLIERYPIISIEDGLAEDDWDGWKLMTKRLGSKVQLVGDDLFVTNTKRLEAGIKLEVANAILVKVNQIGTVSEAMSAVEMAQHHGYKAVISHRSGETEDTFIADLAVAVNAGQIKTGAPCRSDRVAKYNRLLGIEEELDGTSVYATPFPIEE